MATSGYANDLTDEEWVILEPHLPEARHLGRPRKWSLREILNGLFYILRGGNACLGQSRLQSALEPCPLADDASRFATVADGVSLPSFVAH